MSRNHHISGDNAIDRILTTTVLWILIPFVVHFLNYIRIAINNIPTIHAPYEQVQYQNEFFQWYVNAINLLKPSWEMALLHLALVLFGVAMTWVSLRGILRPIYTILGIIFAIWLSNFIGLDAMLIDFPLNDDMDTMNEKEIEQTKEKEDDGKLVCHNTNSLEINQILSQYEISKIITYNCNLDIDSVGNSTLTCPNSWPAKYQFTNIQSFQTTSANLLVTEQGNMIQFKLLGNSLTCN